MLTNGLWHDIIDDFLSLTEGGGSPEIYRRWCAIGMLGGALERRVWTVVGNWTTFANLYLLLVGPPGTGKHCIEDARLLARATTKWGANAKAFQVAPDSMTKASLIDSLVRAKTTMLPPTGGPFTYSSLQIYSEEFQVLLPSYDQELIGTLNRLFNNEKDHEEVRRTGTVKQALVEHPQINILAGAQPSYFVSTFPEEAWSTGFARRIIMIYAPEPPHVDLDWQMPDRTQVTTRLLHGLSLVSGLWGQMQWHRDAFVRIKAWYDARMPPVPTHSKLIHYNHSRLMFLTKLTMVAAISATGGMVIQATDVERALGWLLEAERLMPDVFREMTGKSDFQVLEEMHLYLFQLWSKERKGFHTSAMVNFLATRVPSEKVEKIIMVAERANMIARVAGTQDSWLPRPKSSHGVE